MCSRNRRRLLHDRSARTAEERERGLLPVRRVSPPDGKVRHQDAEGHKTSSVKPVQYNYYMHLHAISKQVAVGY